MASHQISIRDKVYKKLLKLKKKEESFSDVIDRFIPSENELGEILKLSGIATDQEDEIVLSIFKQSQDQMRKGFRNRLITNSGDEKS
jgi:predicted CopG family antitoxin